MITEDDVRGTAPSGLQPQLGIDGARLARARAAELTRIQALARAI